MKSSTTMRMRTKAGLLVVLLAGCPSSPAPIPGESRDYAALHSLMGINQKLVFSLQSHVGDPDELDKLAVHFETIQALRPYDDDEKNRKLHGWSGQIARQMRELRAEEWTPQTRKE